MAVCVGSVASGVMDDHADLLILRIVSPLEVLLQLLLLMVMMVLLLCMKLL